MTGLEPGGGAGSLDGKMVGAPSGGGTRWDAAGSSTALSSINSSEEESPMASTVSKTWASCSTLWVSTWAMAFKTSCSSSSYPSSAEAGRLSKLKEVSADEGVSPTAAVGGTSAAG